ncbi:IclR family transcriptional regulator [Rhizobium sp. OAE497]|uniref:IclR family transcriptional regulator n=1 Tax=Rhizobium sp. OAE497 TaxID=2663796 RepID=UPI0018F57031
MTPPDSSPTKAKGQRNEIRLIARAASILRALAEEPSGLSLGQIAKQTGLARATVQRLVGAMEVERLVATEVDKVGVRIGSEIPRIATLAYRDIRQFFRTAIEQLHQDVEESVDLTLLQGNAAVVIDQVQGAGRVLRVVSQVGSALPLYCTSNGKAHLSQMSDADVAEIIAGGLPKITPQTITDGPTLLAEITKIRAGGIAADEEEYAAGVCALSLPVRGVGNASYALGVLMPRQRYDERAGLVREALAKCRASIETVTGH